MAAQGRQASGRTRSEYRFTQWADIRPESLATAAGSRNAEVAALRRQANEELGGDACIAGGLFI
ncbi:hypothetical protein [Bacillus sp. 2205SS5-2]|uniref:hypothetical protein n=1 Tax=Bacillus sp. 2205SS5-2 TaxID=3109031 RepID=UPI0030049C0C